MAFTTEFVMGAGGSAETWTVSTSSKLYGSNVTIGTTSVPAGQWLVVFSASPYNTSRPWSVTLNGSTRTITSGTSPSEGISANGEISHHTTVTGPATVTASVSSNAHSVAVGTLRVARIG